MRSDTWKVIFYLLIMSLHSDFLLKSQKFLFGIKGVRLNDFVSISMTLWSFQLLLLGHSQNLIMFSWWWLKNSLRSLSIRVACFWSKCKDRSKIFFAAWIEFVMTMILDISCEQTAWMIPHLMTKNSASELVTLIVWWRVLTIGLLWTWIWAINTVTLFLMLVFIITSALVRELEDSIAKASSCWMYFSKVQSLHLLNK